jgi:hypothetical protein
LVDALSIRTLRSKRWYDRGHRSTAKEAFRLKMARFSRVYQSDVDAISVFSTRPCVGVAVLHPVSIARWGASESCSWQSPTIVPLKLDPEARETFCPSKGLHHLFINPRP